MPSDETKVKTKGEQGRGCSAQLSGQQMGWEGPLYLGAGLLSEKNANFASHLYVSHRL